MTTKKRPRKVRSDMQVGNLEKKLGLPEGTIRNPSGRNTRSDKTVKAIRKELGKKGSHSSKKSS